MKKKNGYLTLEASMLSTFIVGIILLFIYLWFFQYDRAILETETMIAGIRGLEDRNIKQEDRLKETTNALSLARSDFYIAFENCGELISTKNGKLIITAEGELECPFVSMLEWFNTPLQTTARFEGNIISEEDFLLDKKAFKKLVNNVEDRLKEKTEE